MLARAIEEEILFKSLPMKVGFKKRTKGSSFKNLLEWQIFKKIGTESATRARRIRAIAEGLAQIRDKKRDILLMSPFI